MNTVFKRLALGVAVALVVGCSDSANTEKPKFDIEQALSEANESLKRRAEAGDASAQYELGSWYEAGKGIEKDQAQAFVWWRKAAEGGNPDAQYKLGEICSDPFMSISFYHAVHIPKDLVTPAQAVVWYRKAAEQGHVDAQSALGWAYFNGKGVAKDSAQAAIWWRKAAEQGNAYSQNNLGAMYDQGEGVPKDAVQAAVWYRKAAEQGNADAQSALGWAYSVGEGVPKDAAQAVVWYRKAAEQGHADAQFALGWAYDSGEGVSKDTPQAVTWYRKAAEQGSANAQFALGQLYSYGEGVTKDAIQAVAWYRKAAEQGLAVAQSNLGEKYAEGEGVPKDATLAANWFRKAAEQGDVDGQFRLGLEYAFGTGVPNDLVRAYMWANLAAAQGGRVAKIASELRDDISERMSTEQIAEAQRLTREWKPGQHAGSATDPGSPSNGAMEKALAGTAFFVSKQGHLLTNRHVVHDCRQVRLAGSDKPLKILPQDEVNDLALLQTTGKPKAVAVFRAANDLRQGESIAAYGYPLQGALAAGGNLSPGVVSALAGLGNNTSQIQITAPVQQGNSGGPVLDGKGQVVGVVVQKLDAVKVAKLTGDVPQNVNFAINASTTRAFLDSNQVQYQTGSWWTFWQKNLSDIAEDARAYTVVVECWK